MFWMSVRQLNLERFVDVAVEVFLMVVGIGGDWRGVREWWEGGGDNLKGECLCES